MTLEPTTAAHDEKAGCHKRASIGRGSGISTVSPAKPDVVGSGAAARGSTIAGVNASR